MKIQRKQTSVGCPVTSAAVAADAKAAFDDLVRFCRTCEEPFWKFEKQLLIRIAVLGACKSGKPWRKTGPPQIRSRGWRCGNTFKSAVRSPVDIVEE